MVGGNKGLVKYFVLHVHWVFRVKRGLNQNIYKWVIIEEQGEEKDRKRKNREVEKGEVAYQAS